MNQSLLKKKLLMQYPLIVGAENPILRKQCTKIDRISPEILRFGEDLLELMWLYDWVWLAAPQVWKTIRMAAFTQWDTTTKPRRQTMEDVMINPEIISFSDQTCNDEEGCLSLPGITWLVTRPTSIRFAYRDLHGKKVVLQSTWFNARIILHELDHLDGILFIDKINKKE
jgi:peptide deformylase